MPLPAHRPSHRRLLVAAGGIALLTASALAAAGAPAAVAAPTAAADARFTLAWSKVLGAAGTGVILSSPGVGVLDSGGPSVIVGNRTGQLWAFHAGNGVRPAGWPVSTGAAVDSTPAVSGSGSTARVYVGLGTAGKPTVGGIAAYSAAGKTLWTVKPRQTPSSSTTVGVQGSVAVGKIATASDVTAGAMGQLQYAVSSAGKVLPGFPWFQADSNFSSPALNDLNGDGRDDIIIGGDSTAGVAYGKTYTNGGVLRVVRPTGTTGHTQPWDAVSCEYRSNQTIQSSPAVGRFLADRGVGIVVGTGRTYAGASDTNAVLALDKSCKLQWRTLLGGPSLASPSLVDTDQNGSLEVITASTQASTSTVYDLRGSTGEIRWSRTVNGVIYGQITSIDIDGRRNLLVGSSGGVTVLDAQTGAVTGTLTTGVVVQNTVAVSLDPGGAIGVTVAGFNGSNQGVVEHYRLAGATATSVTAFGQWPMFHHDPLLRGAVTGG